MGDTFSIQRVSYGANLEPIQAIRRQVFQVEQGVPPELEFDEYDEAATHFLAYQGGEAIGTARIRYLTTEPDTEHSDPIAKIERVAVLAKYRQNGIGKQLMQIAIAHLQRQGIASIKINAQLQVQSFYERLGFSTRGDVFEEAGIPHIEMWYESLPPNV